MCRSHYIGIYLDIIGIIAISLWRLVYGNRYIISLNYLLELGFSGVDSVEKQ